MEAPDFEVKEFENGGGGSSMEAVGAVGLRKWAGLRSCSVGETMSSCLVSTMESVSVGSSIFGVLDGAKMEVFYV